MKEASTCAWAAERLFDGQHVLLDHAVVTSRGVIVGVMPREALPHYVLCTRHPGTTLIPGLIDTHVHVMRWQSALFLAYGVTTVRDVGNDLEWIRAQQQAQEEGSLSPRIRYLGPLLDGPTPIHPAVSRACPDLAAGVTAIRDVAAAGASGIKLYCGLPAAWLPALAAEIHSAGLKASMHCQGTGVMAAAKAGIDEFFHLDGIAIDVWPDHPPGWLGIWGLPGFAETADAQQRVADEIGRQGMTATPTLSYWESQWRIRAADYDPPREAPHVPAQMTKWQATMSNDSEASEQWQRATEAAQGFTELLLQRGVRVLPGSDVPCGGQTPGLSLWREMSLLSGAGMPAVDVLAAATSGAADFLECPHLGRLAAGCPADLVIVKGDPTRQIPATPDIVAVVQGGVPHTPDDLRAEADKEAATVTEDPWSFQWRMHTENG